MYDLLLLMLFLLELLLFELFQHVNFLLHGLLLLLTYYVIEISRVLLKILICLHVLLHL